MNWPFFLLNLEDRGFRFCELGIQISFDFVLSSEVAFMLDRGVRVLPTNGETLSNGLDFICVGFQSPFLRGMYFSSRICCVSTDGASLSLT